MCACAHVCVWASGVWDSGLYQYLDTAFLVDVLNYCRFYFHAFLVSQDYTGRFEWHTRSLTDRQ